MRTAPVARSGVRSGPVECRRRLEFVVAPRHLRFRRVLIKPLDAYPDAIRHACEMEGILFAGTIGWTRFISDMVERAGSQSAGDRQRPWDSTGLEDMTVLPDGQDAKSNPRLAQTAVPMVGSARGR